MNDTDAQNRRLSQPTELLNYINFNTLLAFLANSIRCAMQESRTDCSINGQGENERPQTYRLCSVTGAPLGVA